jgi:integrase
VIEQGFIEFARRRGNKPLFHNPGQYKEDIARKLVGRSVGEWIGKIDGVKAGRIHRKDPNHAWRHYFKTVANELGIDEKTSDAITGHAQTNTARKYGTVSLEKKAAAIRRLPVPGAALVSEAA